ncbi:putative glutamyl-tRNA amidotransferase subunit A [Lasiosphaeria ovina]|uniref:Glutamyl-tRNA amidotransferase subunit A n=1 Tax=Lasiosphaeria ovina TaxID=92902 RepID=A0AAE0KJQ8_9PEZI|nr:putative glutamyl-tRNA amidotransferase subunit A [Lasiosphaeria ovina]
MASFLLALFSFATCSQGLMSMANRLVSTVVRLGNVAYYMPPTPFLHAGSPPLGAGQTAEPCTLLTLESSVEASNNIQSNMFETTLNEFDLVDDVWSAGFLHTLVVQTSNPTLLNPTEIQNTLFRIPGVKAVHIVQVSGTSLLHQGPYFLHHGHLHHAYRLYPDTVGAFIVATVPASDNNTFRSLDVSAYGEDYPSTLSVAVPSRLYFTKTDEKPYAGLRLAIKDIIDLKGLKTGASSRAYTALYSPRTANAEAVQRLVDLGFVVVGKLKTTQFADSEWPTCDWVDYHGPFNPRGDGYLTTSGSSAGSAAAIAAYEWLDFSLGTDTLGSIRAPAAAQGIFGMRSSLGAASFSGIVPYSPKFDTLGGFARTAGEFKVLAEALYGSPCTTDAGRKPTKILYPVDYWPANDEPSQEVFEAFISRLEAFLNVNRTAINLESAWQKHRPDGVSESLSEYFEHVFEWAANPDQWAGLFNSFLPDYEAKFGKPPVLNPQLRFKVEYVQSVTPEQQAEAVGRLKVYQSWFYKHVMPPADETGYSSTVLVLPWTTGEPEYRDRYRDGPQQFTGIGFFFYNLGPYAEAPELIIPVGVTPYISKLTGQAESLPAALGLVGAKGSDVALARLVSALMEDSGKKLESEIGVEREETTEVEVIADDL